MSVDSSVDGEGAAGMAGNVVLGGLIGAGVDASTGAMHSHKPNPLSVKLVPTLPADEFPIRDPIPENEASEVGSSGAGG